MTEKAVSQTETKHLDVEVKDEEKGIVLARFATLGDHHGTRCAIQGHSVDNEIHVTTERFEDAGEQDAEGYYDFYYSGLIHTIRVGNVTYTVYLYDGESGVATFKGTEHGSKNTFNVETSDPSFRASVDYLVANCGVERLSLYEPELGYFKTYDVSEVIV